MIDNSRLTWWPALKAAEAEGDARAAYLIDKFQNRPEEELYKVDDDPYEMTNLADDPSYAVFKLMDDEKVVYEAAQKALEGAVTARNLQREHTLLYAEKYRTLSVEQIIADFLNVDQSRAISEANIAKMADAFNATAQEDTFGKYLECWYRLDVFSVNSRP